MIKRPIAVFMTFLALVVMGIVAYFTLPVSLLPDIPVPEITVQVNVSNLAARDVEERICKPLRSSLLQVSGLNQLQSIARDGSALLRLHLKYGVSTDLAFIEVNEKIDVAMNRLPRDIERPQAVKASALDVPAFFLNMTLKGDEPYGTTDPDKFLELSRVAETIVKRRIEQLPQVTMADVTGTVSQEIQVLPDLDRMQSAGITISQLESAIMRNNVEPGSMSIQDGHYEYKIKFSAALHNTRDIEDIFIQQNDRIFRLKDFCTVRIMPENNQGYSVVNGKRAVTMAIVKHADENMNQLTTAMNDVVARFRQQYPDIEFTMDRNQTELLDFTIGNLKHNFLLGLILVSVVVGLLLGDAKAPVIIGISVAVSLIISLLCFYLCGKSLNIISLSGLILALGMMIDSAIIVTENIGQYQEQGYTLDQACIQGTTEVITPIFSSTLTTISVFLPLICLSGIAGALFMDEAFAVSVGLLVSYFTGIILLPVLYRMIYTRNWIHRDSGWCIKRYRDAINRGLYQWYDHLIKAIFGHPGWVSFGLIAALPFCVYMFRHIPHELMPQTEQTSMRVRIDWNENIHADENLSRIYALSRYIDTLTMSQGAYVGRQQFLLRNSENQMAQDCEFFFEATDIDKKRRVQTSIKHWIDNHYPNAAYAFSPSETVFEKTFSSAEAPLMVRLYWRNAARNPAITDIQEIERDIAALSDDKPEPVEFNQEILLQVDPEKLMRYNVSNDEIIRVLWTAFNRNQIAELYTYQRPLPVKIKTAENSVFDVVSHTMLGPAGSSHALPLRNFITIQQTQGLKYITAGNEGEYIPLIYQQVRHPDELMAFITEAVNKTDVWDIDFSGRIFSSRRMVRGMIIVLLISLMLMYFILVAQFENFLQPLIVLAEIPIDIAIALLCLRLFGHSLNLMSAIGIVVSCGIVINDSILKIDMINTLRKHGIPVDDAIHIAGQRRLRPILMTSLTTIFALLPLLFTSDLGSKLQAPLVIAMIAALSIGTIISICVIPFMYSRIIGDQVKIQDK